MPRQLREVIQVLLQVTLQRRADLGWQRDDDGARPLREKDAPASLLLPPLPQRPVVLPVHGLRVFLPVVTRKFELA
jgi:hypothetical protein